MVKIIERKTGPERNLQFLIDLDAGKISPLQDRQQDSGPSNLGGHLDYPDCEKMVQILAPDHRLAAYCKVAESRYTLRTQNVEFGEQVREWSPGKEWGITGLAWSPDSKSMAVLLARERVDLDAAGIVSMISGHPIPLATFNVVLLSSQLDHELELPVIRKDAPSGWARVDWIR